MRRLSDAFLYDLKDSDGILNPLLERVWRDDGLMLAIRSESIELYYRGGTLLHVIGATGAGTYRATATVHKYNKQHRPIELPDSYLRKASDAQAWVRVFPAIKEIMDAWKATGLDASRRPRGSEREFTQTLARQNNRSSISGQTEYFITDIEYRGPDGYVDMVGVRWPASKRRSGDACRPVLIESKYGDGALAGAASVIKHLRDMVLVATDARARRELCETIEVQFRQIDAMGLFTFNHATPPAQPRFAPLARPELVVILADHNPRSTLLERIVRDPEVAQWAQCADYDLRFFVSSFSGYGLHCANMLDLDAFSELVRGTPGGPS